MITQMPGPAKKARISSAEVKTFAACLVGGWLFYWWLVAKSQAQQLIAGAFIGLSAGIALLSLARIAKLSFRFEWAWGALLLRRLPSKIVCDLGQVVFAVWRAAVLRRRITGRYQRIHFNSFGGDARSAARRALVFGGLSLPPNSFAVQAENGRSLLIHQLIPQPQPEDDWPV